MLEEAVEVIRALWTGDVVSHRGTHYTVDTARIYTLPEQPPPIYVSAFGPKAVDVAARIGDGFVSVSPDEDLLARYRKQAGADKVIQGGFKVCYADTPRREPRSRTGCGRTAGFPASSRRSSPPPGTSNRRRVS
jgi:alkanesulfonate monooxygenase SsuD/methylene tetrahydromethanopterin reductase-like flavin-dependent oxidoreductase (luciferase family)